MTVSFEDGIIGKFAKFEAERFGVKPLLGRLWGAALVSSAIPEPVLLDGLGKVTGAVYVADIEPTGTGKSPALNPALEILYRWQKELDKRILGPSSFSPQSFAEAFTGIKKTRMREEISPTPNLVIVQDEMSKWFAERTKEYIAGIDESMSMAWDGRLPPSSFIGRGSQSGMRVSLSIIGATSHAIYDYKSAGFFTQGAGCRFNWTLGQIQLPPLSPDFFYAGNEDSDLESLIDDVVEQFRIISQAKKILMVDDSEWRPWANTILKEVRSLPSIHAGFRAKQIQNSLKLGIDFSASRLAYDKSEEAIMLMKEELRRSMADCEELFKQFKQLRKEWSVRPVSMELQTTIKSSKLDFVKLLNIGDIAGRFTKADARMGLDTTDTSGLKDMFNTLIDDGRVKMVTKLAVDGRTMLKGDLTEAEYAKFKQKNILPAVYEVTKKGKEWLDNNA